MQALRQQSSAPLLIAAQARQCIQHAGMTRYRYVWSHCYGRIRLKPFLLLMRCRAITALNHGKAKVTTGPVKQTIGSPILRSPPILRCDRRAFSSGLSDFSQHAIRQRLARPQTNKRRSHGNFNQSAGNAQKANTSCLLHPGEGRKRHRNRLKPPLDGRRCSAGPMTMAVRRRCEPLPMHQASPHGAGGWSCLAGA